MSRMAQFILTLIVGLALLTWAASGVVQTTVVEWFERDIGSRAQLVLVGANQSLANAWYGESGELEKRLQEISRGRTRHGRGGMQFGLDRKEEHSRIPRRVQLPGGWQPSPVFRYEREYGGPACSGAPSRTLPTGRVQVSVMPITNEGLELGFRDTGSRHEPISNGGKHRRGPSCCSPPDFSQSWLLVCRCS